MQSLPNAYLRGLELFDEGEFFACHDILEELWTETVGVARDFLQGLIQAAVSLYQFDRGNLEPARRMALSACRYLEPYQPSFWSLDVTALIRGMMNCFRELFVADSLHQSRIELDSSDVPEMSSLLQIEAERSAREDQ